MPVISPRRYSTTGSTYTPQVTSGTYRSSYTSSTSSDRANYSTDSSSSYLSRSSYRSSLSRNLGNDTSSSSSASATSRYGVNKYTRTSIERDLPPTTGSRYSRSDSRSRDTTNSSLSNTSSSSLRHLASSGADLYEKYSPSNYVPRCELSRSRSLSETQKLAKDKTTPTRDIYNGSGNSLGKVKLCAPNSSTNHNNINNINNNFVTNNQAFGLKKYTGACTAKTNATTFFFDSNKNKSTTDVSSVSSQMSSNNNQSNNLIKDSSKNLYNMKATNDFNNYSMKKGGANSYFSYKDDLSKAEIVKKPLTKTKIIEINNNTNGINLKPGNNNLNTNGHLKSSIIKPLVHSKVTSSLAKQNSFNNDQNSQKSELEQITNKVLNIKLKYSPPQKNQLAEEDIKFIDSDESERSKHQLSSTGVVPVQSLSKKLNYDIPLQNNSSNKYILNEFKLNETENKKNLISETKEIIINHKIDKEISEKLENKCLIQTEEKLNNKLFDKDDIISESVRNASLRTTLPPTSSTANKLWDRDRTSISGRTLSDSDSFTLSKPSYSSSSSHLDSHEKSTSCETTEGLCGLRNIGNTCFMNSVLQCLSHTNELTKYVKSQYAPKTTTKDQRIFAEFVKLIKEMWSANTKSVTPLELKSAISSKYRMYSGSTQQDAQEFLRFFLDTLHCAMNGAIKGEKLEIDDNLSDTKKADLTWEWYSKVEKSMIKDLFVGQLKSSLKCTVCGNTSVTFDPFWDLSLPLPSSTKCKLENCLELFIKEEVLDGDEMPTCAKCETRRKSTKSFTIQRFPKYLVIHLKRFSETRWSKLTNIVEFPTGECDLDMSPYASSSNPTPSTFTLYGISNHMGSTAGGHYVALCKHPITRKWHEFNDNIVNDANESNLISSSAYLLFYERS